MSFFENSNRPGLAAVAAVLVIYAVAAGSAAR
jgi:hypothetical protein